MDVVFTFCHGLVCPKPVSHVLKNFEDCLILAKCASLGTDISSYPQSLPELLMFPHRLIDLWPNSNVRFSLWFHCMVLC